eukprot:TRINITY_DN5538_c0_g1_i2.p1 TRINITY_DN5538_c0_g1~~TRINITY_DN5538_c0_g1_i2.p1  ORF type:complete len:198 (+),score=32.87 TRINITY_DN5538_c0_g1_i2:217-810(+)
MSKEDLYDDPGQQAEQAGPGSVFWPAFANVLSHFARNAEEPHHVVTIFHSVRVPPMSINDYFLRIAKYFHCSNECFVLSLIYINRIVMLHPDFSISGLNIHRLVLTASMIAVKFFDDPYCSNAYYARVGGVRTKELNALEGQFLRMIDWSLSVTPKEYGRYCDHVRMAAQSQNVLELAFFPAASTEISDQEDMSTDT